VLHEKEPSLLKAMCAKHRSKFAGLSPVMVTVARELKIAQAEQTKFIISVNIYIYLFI
jgi:hypothetical protein